MLRPKDGCFVQPGVFNLRHGAVRGSEMTEDENELARLSRRQWLWQAGGGLGTIALACLLNEEAEAQGGPVPRLHFPPKAKRPQRRQGDVQ